MEKGKVLSVLFYSITTVIFGVLMFLAWLLDERWYVYILLCVAFSCIVVIREKKILKKPMSSVLNAVVVVVSILAVVFIRPAHDVSFMGNLINESVKFMYHDLKKSTPEQYAEQLVDSYVPYDFGSWSAPTGYTNEDISLSNCHAYLLTKESGNHEKVIYQIHGGAYVLGFANSYNDNALLLSEANNDSDVFSIDYRTAVTAPYPAALDDAVEGYQWLLSKGYKSENIVVAGDSAGGGLSIALSLKLRDTNQELPKCLVLSSPWADLSQEGESYTFNRQNDCGFGSKSKEAIGHNALPTIYAKGDSVYNPYISPVYADFKGMPPMLIQTGDTEMLLSDSTTVAEKAHAAGVDVTLELYEGMWHTFYGSSKLIPEQRKAWLIIESYLNQ